jgi:hypothetical protein
MASNNGGRKGFFVVYGPPGRWKTSEALWAFQDALYVASEENLDQFYTNTRLKEPEAKTLGKKPPLKTVVVDQYSVNGAPVRFDKDGEPVKVPQRETFEQVVIDVTRALSQDKEAGRPPRFRNVIVDEGSVFWDRFLVEIIREMTTGRDLAGNAVEKNRHGPAHHGALQVWTREVIDRFRTILSMGANLVMVCHDTEGGDGKMGGPTMPNQRTSKIIGAAAHLSLLSQLEDGGGSLDLSAASGPKGPRHVWKVPVDQHAKIRGITIDRLHELRYEPLEVVIKECGYST